MKTSIYARVSSEDQAERKTIESQVEFATKYCDLHKLEIADWYKDDGITGTLPLEERPEGARLLQDAKAGKFNLLLVYRLDRLGRSARVILNAVHELEQAGVKIRSMTEPFDTGDPSGRFLLTILAGVADLERETILERLWHGANRAARDGKWLGGIIPFGYKVNDEKHLEINEKSLPGVNMSEADVVRLVYKMVAEEGCSTIKVADYLNALGVPPAYVKDGRKVKKGKRKENTAGIWRPGRIRNIIVNSTYKGIHLYGKRTDKQRELIPRKVPAIVSEEIWEKAQETLKHNQIHSKKNSKRNYLLTGLIKCNVCGQNYHGISYAPRAGRNRNELSYYQCNGKITYRGPLKGKCKSKNVPRKWLEDLVWKDCVNFIRNPGEALKELAASMEQKKSQRASFEAERDAVQKSIYGKEFERESILDLYRKKIISHEDVEKQLQKISKENEYLRRRIQELQQQIDTEAGMENQFDTVQELLVTLREKLKEDPPFEVKKEIVRTLVENIEVRTIFEEDDDGNECPKKARIIIKYRFVKDVIRTGKRAENNLDTLNMYLEKCIPLPSVTHEPPEGDSPGARLRQTRISKDMTIRSLAEAAGLTPETISYIESGRNLPSLSTLRKLSEALRVSICYLGCFEKLPKNTLGQRITKGRLYTGMTKEELARLIGVDPTTILRWERDGNQPSDEHLKKLKQFIKI